MADTVTSTISSSSLRWKPLRVASIPATHVYVRHLAHPDVVRLPDPSGDDLRTPCLFDPKWVRANSDKFDLVHINFGFEFYPTKQLTELCNALDELGIPLVYTAHDLRNPNHPEPGKQDEALGVWMERATEIITLTNWAATRIERLFGRHPVVIPHPNVIPLEEMAARQKLRPCHWDGFRVGIHFKSMRPNMSGAPVLGAALRAAHAREGIRLRVHMHPDLFDPHDLNYSPDLVSTAMKAIGDGNEYLDLHIHKYCADDELWNFISSVDAIVLPYTFGTHSGFLEACRDLGTRVIAPSCGAYGDQGAQHIFASSERCGVDEESLVSAIHEAADAGPAPPLATAYRRSQQRVIADAYNRVFTEVLDQVRLEKVNESA